MQNVTFFECFSTAVMLKSCTYAQCIDKKHYRYYSLQYYIKEKCKRTLRILKRQTLVQYSHSSSCKSSYSILSIIVVLLLNIVNTVNTVKTCGSVHCIVIQKETAARRLITVAPNIFSIEGMEKC